MSQENKSGIIVLGGHVQALGIVRAFGRMGLPVVVIDNTYINISRHSVYCSRSYKVSDDELFGFLKDLGKQGDFNTWQLFPTNDFHVQLLSRNKDLLEEYFVVTTDGWDTVRLFYNKKETYQLALSTGIPIPRTYYPLNEADLRNHDIRFPCILKPAVMYEFYRKTKKKVFLCRNRDELVRQYRRAIQHISPGEIILQDIVRGTGKNQMSACFLFLNGKSVVSLTANRLRQHPPDFGNASTYVETVDLPQLVEYSERILQAAGYNGLCEVEFKKDEADGEFKLLEINPRTWKWHTIAEQAQTPFLETFYNFLTGNEISVSGSPRFASYRHLLTDLPVQLKMFVKGYKSAFRLKKPVVHAVCASDDMKPWFFEKFYLLHFIKNR